MASEKTRIINDLHFKWIIPLPINEMDIFLKSKLSKYYFGHESLYKFYYCGKFNYHCQLGSLMCIINLPLKSKLIRGELLSSIPGDMFVHGWIEVFYKGKEYVIDTSMVKAIPKEIYYQYFDPNKFVELDKKDLFVNNYILYLKEEIKQSNELSLPLLYDTWWQYENNWLQEISDNTKLAAPKKIRKVVKVKKRQ